MLKLFSFLLVITFPITASAKLYSVQLATFLKEKQALNFLKKLPSELKREAFVYRTDRGFFTVRVWVEKKVKNLREKTKLLLRLGIKDFSFVEVDSRKIKRAEIQSELIKEKARICQLKFKNKREFEELLKLILNNALGVQDFKLAEEVAKKGISINPNSSFWYKQLAQILIWTNRSLEAIPYLEKAFTITKSPKIAKKLFFLSLATNNYQLARKVLPYVPNLPDKDIISVYEGSGDIDGLLKFLESKGKEEFLITAANVRLMLGDREKALKDINEVLNKNPYNLRAYLLKASILYSMKKFNEALSALKKGLIYFDPKNKFALELLQNLSDLGWMLNDFETVKKAAEKLIELQKGRWSDYYRLSLIYRFCCPEKLYQLGIQGYRKFKSFEMIFVALDSLYNRKRYKEFLKVINSLDENTRKRIFKDDYLFTAYIDVLYKTGNCEVAKKLVLERLKNKPSPTLLSFLIYMDSDMNNLKELEYIVKNFKKFEKQIPSAFALAYLRLQDSSKAIRLAKFFKKKDPLLYSEILFLCGKEKEANWIRYKLFKNLEKRFRNSKLKSKSEIEDFVYLSSFFYSNARYERLLQQVSPILGEKRMREMYLDYLLKTDQHTKVHFLWRRLKYRLSPWMKLSQALDENDPYLMKETLKKYSKLLPIRDIVTAQREIGNIKKALNTAFRNLQKNRCDDKLYYQFEQLINEYESFVSISPKFLERSGYKEFNLEINDKTALIYRGINLWIHAVHTNPIEKDKGSLSKTFKTNSINLTVEKLSDEGKIKLKLGKFNKDRPFTHVGFTLESHVINELTFKISGDVNGESSDTVYLYLGGKEDRLKTLFSLSRTRYGLDLETGFKRYRSQSNEVLGYGKELSLSFSYLLKSGYPDVSFRTFLEIGRYRNTGNLGNISSLMPYVGNPIPEDSNTLGIETSLGYSRVNSYSRDWKPFLTGSLLYNSKYGWGFNLSGGIGTHLFHEDMLKVEVQSSHNAGKINEHLYQVILNYKRYY
jgi:hypothetical protein